MKLYLFKAAIMIQRSAGTRVAAEFLRRNRVSLEAACWILLGKESRI